MRQDYTEILSKVEERVRTLLPASPEDSWWAAHFGDLPRLPSDEVRSALTEPIRDLVSRGGKRWRPLLMVLVARLHGDEALAMELSPLVELLHNASLVVDDIEDAADLRRGQPAIHVAHGIDAAINSGNFGYFLPFTLIEGAPEEKRALLYRHALQAMRRLHLGQALDIAWHREDGRLPSRDEYYLMCAMKTGVLANLAARLGALCAGADEARAEAFGRVFEKAGVAFQIVDDVRNLRTGNPGKARGDDIVEGKKSLPVILACTLHARLFPGLKELFVRARSGGVSDTSVEEAIVLIEGTGALEAAEAEAAALLESAKTALRALAGSSPGLEALVALFDLLEGKA